MGKYQPSKVNLFYSAWHYQNPKIRRDCFGTDIDFVEVRGKFPNDLKLKALLDIKEENSPDKDLTVVSRFVYQKISEEKKIPIFLVYLTIDWKNTNPCDWKTNRIKTVRLKRIGEKFKCKNPDFNLPPNICLYCRRSMTENEFGEFHCSFCEDIEKIFTEEEYIKWLNNL